jgi:hypothetical protein
VCTSPFFAALVLGRRPKQLLYGDLGGTHLGSPCKNLHQPWTTARHYLPKDAAPYRSRTRRGCFFVGDEALDCSLESAMPCEANGKPDARRRCQVCMKRWLWKLQGQRSRRTPSFLRLKPHVKPSWEYAEGEGLSSPDDFVQPESEMGDECEALQYIWYNAALMKVALRANKVFDAGFEERKTHRHGWRHSTPCNWMELMPKPTLAEICLWCRMTEKTVLLYLKHNGVGGDSSNRTDQISGAQNALDQRSGCVVCDSQPDGECGAHRDADWRARLWRRG